MKILYLPNSKCQQRQFEKPNFTAYPVLMAMEAEYYRKQGHEIHWENAVGRYDKIISKPEGLPFLSLPHPDRIFTKAFDKKYQQNGNFKYHPGTYIQAANGCWHGKCSFCVEQNNKWEVRDVDDVIQEIEEIKSLNFKEVFDDSGTFPTGDWLDKFISRKLGIFVSANIRINSNIPYADMFNSGFRMLLFGIESANTKTLEKINKGIKYEDIIPTIKKAAKAGLACHICVVFGWEWETDEDALNTLKLVHYLLRKGYAKTAQASFIHQQNIKGNESQRHYIRDIYNVWRYPDFWFNKIRDIHNVNDLKYFLKMIKTGLKWR